MYEFVAKALMLDLVRRRPNENQLFHSKLMICVCFPKDSSEADIHMMLTPQGWNHDVIILLSGNMQIQSNIKLVQSMRYIYYLYI